MHEIVMFMYELVVKFKSCYYVAISIQINFSEFCKAFGLYLNLSEQTKAGPYLLTKTKTKIIFVFVLTFFISPVLIADENENVSTRKPQ